jgi:tetratricopeptide (TPR) repeat protein
MSAPRLLAAAALTLGAIAVPPAVIAQRPSADPGAGLRQARALLDAGAYRQAESSYVELARVLFNERYRGPAYFGRALAAQQRLTSGDTLEPPVTLDTITRAYDTAVSLLPGELRAPAENNIALLYQTLGRHREALEHFRAASDASHGVAKAAYWVRIGGEHEALNEFYRAFQAYDRALTHDSASTEAVRGVLRALVADAPPRAVLERADRWRNDTATAPLVLDAMTGLLLRESRPTESEAKTALVYFAAAIPVARVGPPSFAAKFREPLLRIRSARRELAPGVEALIEAYNERDARSRFREAPSASWWRNNAQDGRAAWSGVLRWLGDWYNEQDADVLAASYYETAIGRGAEGLMDPSVDRKALVPLALIYAKSDKASAQRLQYSVGQFTEMLFSAKGAAYERNDLEQIRDLHTTLGTYYAEKGKWTGDGAENAEFQLSRMRDVTKKLEGTGKRVSDPPELLAKLALHYEATDRPQLAQPITREVRARYEQRGRPDKADSLFVRVRGLPVKATDRTTPITRPPAPRDTLSSKKP